MRGILVDWIIEVHLKFKLLPETLFLTVSLIDRYLEKTQIMRTKLQLVAVSAMLIASKYEEIYAPEVRDFVFITDNAYTKEEILTIAWRAPPRTPRTPRSAQTSSRLPKPSLLP